MQPEHQILSSPQLPQCNCDLRRSVLRTFCKYSRERDSRGLPQRLSTIRPDTTSDPAKPSTTSTSCKYSNGRWYRRRSPDSRGDSNGAWIGTNQLKKILSRKTYQRQPHNRSIDLQSDRSAHNTVWIPLRSIQTRSAQRMQPAQWSHADHMLLLAPPAIMELADSFFFDPRAAASIDDDPPATSTPTHADARTSTSS